MRDEEWRELDDEALERMLVERWLYRGMTLGVILVAAVAATYLGTHGVVTWLDHATIGALLALAFSAGVVGFMMRREDFRIHRELRRRRSPPPRGTA